MREVIYICDNCKRKYPYKLEAGAPEREILAMMPVINQEWCRKCIKNKLLK